MAVAIRDATHADAPLLATLIRDSFRDVADRFELTYENCPTHPSNCSEAWVESALAKGVTYYILERDGVPGGCVALEHASPDVCYLERLAVLPQYRGRGWGESLVNHAVHEAGRIGARRVEIALIAEHIELRNCYGKRGFVLKETKRFSHLPFAVTFMGMSV